MLYIGLDIHWRMSVICILDKNGKLIKFTTVHGPWSQVIEVLKGLKRAFAICYEASCGYGHIHDQLGPIAKRVVVAHPGQLRLIFRSKKKNDRVDAKKLATLLFLDQVPQVHGRCQAFQQEQEDRQLFRPGALRGYERQEAFWTHHPGRSQHGATPVGRGGLAGLPAIAPHSGLFRADSKGRSRPEEDRPGGHGPLPRPGNAGDVTKRRVLAI